MSEYKLFLDDVREVKDIYFNNTDPDWVVVKCFEEFQSHILKNGLPYFVSMDHDLGLQHYNSEAKELTEKTGLDCARWLIDYCFDNKIKLPKYKVHSFNPVGAANIQNALNDYKKYDPNS